MTVSVDGPGRGSRTRATAQHGRLIHQLDDIGEPGRATPKRGLRVTRIPANPTAWIAHCSGSARLECESRPEIYSDRHLIASMRTLFGVRAGTADVERFRSRIYRVADLYGINIETRASMVALPF